MFLMTAVKSLLTSIMLASKVLRPIYYDMLELFLKPKQNGETLWLSKKEKQETNSIRIVIVM